MTLATRQSQFRKRKKLEGMVDIRFEVKEGLRDRLRAKASDNGRSMKEEMRQALVNHLAN